MTRAKRIRCAIYTRKSSEEGLEQEFNSLHAQREACEAYIKSQQQEGWKLIKTAYDDGGFSGGSMERPALQQLLREIHAQQIDVVVVYKVDRLTRSLTDFSRIVEIFDANNVSFVSVTQAFNTTTSMGRLTLNVLLSFAQFEREVTGERIRDKIAASRKKGMWMGGCPPLGYDVCERKLEVNPAEANQVRLIYERYLALGSVPLLVQDLRASGIRSKQWISQAGKSCGGGFMGRGALYKLLQNRLYLGEVSHKGQVYPGEHEAILDADLWNAVNTQVSEHRRKHHGNRELTMSLLTGLLHDDTGHPMTPSRTYNRYGREYRYYLSRALIEKDRRKAGSLSRVSAAVIEPIILEHLRKRITTNEWQTISQADAAGRASLLRHYLKRITLSRDHLAIEFAGNPSRISSKQESRQQDDLQHGSSSHQARIVEIPFKLEKRGGETLIVQPRNGSTDTPLLDSTLVKALGRAWQWRRDLERGRVSSVVEIARKSGCTERYVSRLLPIAYLAPDIIEAILEGRQPAGLTLAKICRAKIPLDWRDQRKALGFAADTPLPTDP